MKHTLLIALALLGMAAAATAQAYNQTATCPYDGETAYFSGSKSTPNGSSCNYRHTGRDPQAHQQVRHSFWIPCSN